MAKISELVKTYRLLSDPNAPDWNVKFLGGVVIALALVAAAGALVWSNAATPEVAPAAAVESPPEAPAACSAEEIAAAAARGDSIEPGQVLASGCAVPAP
jgi:hypothetical protein